MGSECSTMFSDCVFENCTLVVLSGATAVLNSPQFRDMGSSVVGVSIFAHGTRTKVVVKGGTIHKGTQGATVQAGARLEASDVSITNVQALGVEVKDEGSSLKLSGCRIHDHCSLSALESRSMGVHVHARSRAQLFRLYITGAGCNGVVVNEHASATLCDCSIRDALGNFVYVFGRGTGNLTRCNLSDSQHSHGLLVQEPSSFVHAEECHFVRSRQCGAMAADGGTLAAHSCTSSGNRKGGYHVEGAESVLELNDCSSEGEPCGCSASMEAQITAIKVIVNGSTENGYEVFGGSSAVLQECTVSNCGHSGVLARDEGSEVMLEHCILKVNGQCGALAEKGALVTVVQCSSNWNGVAGFTAESDGKVYVSSCSSDGDKTGCSVE